MEKVSLMRHEFRISFAPISMFGPKQTERKACNIYTYKNGKWTHTRKVNGPTRNEGGCHNPAFMIWHKKISHLSEFWVHFWFFELSARDEIATILVVSYTPGENWRLHLLIIAKVVAYLTWSDRSAKIHNDISLTIFLLEAKRWSS